MDQHPANSLSRRAAFQPETADAERRSITVRWSTGSDVRRSAFGRGEYVERLSMDPKAVDLERLNAGAPVLNAHRAESLGDILGVVERAWLDDGAGFAVLRFSDRADVEPYWRDIAGGIIRSVSIGYKVDDWSRTDDNGEGMPLYTAERWTPYEVSMVPIPADPTATVRDGGKVSTMVSGDFPMTDEQNQAGQEPVATEHREMPTAPPTTTADDSAAVAAARDDARRARLEAQITRAAMIAGYPADKVPELVSQSRAMEDATFSILSWQRDQQQAAQPPANPAPFTVTRAEGDGLVERMGAALRWRINPSGELPDDGKEFRHSSLLDMARLCLERAGVNPLGMSRGSIASRALHVSSDFPNLFTSTAERSLLDAYEEEPHGWDGFCRRKDFRDFREVKDVALSASMVPTQLLEGGEYTSRSIREDAMASQLVTYAQKISITREMIVNDDLDALGRVPELLGRGCRILENNLVINLITSDAATAIDATALFDAGHSNTGSGALSITSISDGITAMRKQTDPAGNRMNLAPAFLLVPAALELEARQIIQPPTYYPANATGAAGPNPYTGSMSVYVDARFDAASATQFYLVSNPNRIPTIRYGYLEGEMGPAIDPVETRDPDGLTLLCRHDFGVSLQDFRGFYRSSGS